MRGLLGAVAFLARVPVPPAVTAGTDLARAVAWFPVVGGGVGLVVGAVTVGAGAVAPPLVAAVLAVGAGLLLTGAFHEDGLADTFDAVGAGPGRRRALEVMKDSRLGTFGAAALFVALTGRVATLAALPGLSALLVAPAAGALGRGAAVTAMSLTPPAAAARARRRLPARPAAVAPVLGAAAASAVGAALLGLAVVPALLVAGVTTALTLRWAVRRLGGVTGDVFGAVTVLAELGVLTVRASPRCVPGCPGDRPVSPWSAAGSGPGADDTGLVSGTSRRRRRSPGRSGCRW